MAIQNLQISKSTVQDAQVVSTTDNEGLKASGDTSAVARMGMWVLVMGFGGFLLLPGMVIPL